MIDIEQVTQFDQLIQNAESILIVYPKNPSTDIVASATALYETIAQQGKRVTLTSPETPNASQIHDITSIDKTVTEIGNQNLVIGFDYSEEAIDKVSYHISDDNKKFYLTIKPRAGYSPLDAKAVDFNYTGIEADLLILVGVKSLNELEHIYFGYEDTYERLPLITFNSSPGRDGIIDITTEGAEGMSQCLASMLLQTSMTIADTTATNLLRGIEQTTQHFSSLSATADTFEIVAQLMRLGARRSRPAMAVAPSLSSALKNTESAVPKATPTPKETPKAKRISQSEKAGSLKFQPSAGAPKGG